MTNHLGRHWRSAFAALAAVGSLGLLHCDMAKKNSALDHRPAEQPTMNQPEKKPAQSTTGEPTAVGGGPTAPQAATPTMPEATKAEPSTTLGISAVEQYLDGKGTDKNRFALEGLRYVQGCPYLTQEGVDSVDTLSDLLTKHPEAKVKIESYADNVGSDQANQQLSKRRADVIKKQLVQCGIQPSRIEIAAHGEEDPIANNDSDEGKAQNRRTEIIVHK